MRYRTAAGATALAVTVILLGVTGCGGEGTASVPSDAVPATELGSRDVATVRRAELSTGAVLTGSLHPYRVVKVKAQVPGTVSGVRVDRGTPVRRGQALASINADGIRSQAAGAQAAVAAAESGLALAKQQLESARILYEAGAMSEIDLNGARAAYAAAEAQLAAARAQAAAAGEAAAHTTVTAPITGIVSERFVEGGEAVNPGQELFTVVNSEYLELAGQVPIEDAGRIRPGMEVVFTLDAHPGEEFRGSVDRVEPVANLQTRQVGLYVRLANPDGSLLAGQFATGRIVAERLEDALVIPETAVRGSGEDTYVLAIEDGEVVRRAVVLGPRDRAAGIVAVVSGLSEGEQVIVTPAGTIAPGTRVRIRGAEAAPAPVPAATGEES